MGGLVLNLVLLAVVGLCLTKCALDNLLCTGDKSVLIYAVGYSALSVAAIASALVASIVGVLS